MVHAVFVYISLIFFFTHVHSIRIQVKPEIFPRYWPYKGDLNFSKDWSTECDVPCVWTGNPDNVDGVFYIIKNNQDASRAFNDRKIVPISIGGSTEGEHYYDLLTIKNFKKHFNASAFLDTRSDIPWLMKVSSYEQMQNVPRIQNPIKKAVIALFNCDSRNNRETIIVEMSEIVPIDRIGNCIRNSPWPLCVDLPCEKEDVLKRYMFCLAFENGITPGYATEKIHECFRSGSLPVYYGTAHVSRLVPTGSYINMRDFESHTALAEYMVRLMGNEALYDSYFEWKKRPLDPSYIRRNKPFWDYRIQCRVCRYVWVKQMGLSWDRVTQNATVYLNTSLDLDQDPFYTEQMEIQDPFYTEEMEIQDPLYTEEMEIPTNNDSKRGELQYSKILLLSCLALVVLITFVIRVMRSFPFRTNCNFR